MHLFQFRVIAQIGSRNAALKEKLQLFPAGIGGRAAMTATAKAPQALAYFNAVGPIFAIKPAFQQARHKSITAPKHVEHLNRKTWSRFALVKAVGDIAGKGHSSRCTAFANQRGSTTRTNRAQGLNRICAAPCDVELFFGADDQIKQMQACLQLLRYLPALSTKRLSPSPCLQHPKGSGDNQYRARSVAVLAREVQRLNRRGLDLRIA